MSHTLDQFTGCILGLALGDALGAVVEARPAADARRYVDEVLRAGQAGAAGREGYPFGQVTDDTQLMRELLESILDGGAFDPARFASRLQAFVGLGHLVGGGPAAHTTAAAIQAGVPWSQAGMPAPYAGNGAAMRVGPLGLLYGDDSEALARVTCEQARVTHRDPRAAAGALAIATAVAVAARGRSIRAGEFLEEIGESVVHLDAGVAGSVRQVRGWAALPMKAALAHLRRHPIAPKGEWPGHGVSAFVTTSVCWSLYAFLREPDSWWDAVCLAIRVGGDTDTLGAMTGTIAGARHGGTALPAHLTATLTDRGRWRLADLETLAQRCYSLSRGGIP